MKASLHLVLQAVNGLLTFILIGAVVVAFIGIGTLLYAAGLDGLLFVIVLTALIALRFGAKYLEQRVECSMSQGQKDVEVKIVRFGSIAGLVLVALISFGTLLNYFGLVRITRLWDFDQDMDWTVALIAGIIILASSSKLYELITGKELPRSVLA